MKVKLMGMMMALVALITFTFIADKLVWDCKTWECMCTHQMCTWCHFDENNDDDFEWRMYNHEAYDEYLMMFNEIYSMIEVKRARNGALMVKGANSTSFKFAKKG